ncbi:LysE family translocator [Gandjariella thermophila]|uniref:Amino acid transporter LysE n=1 Tax=Gandjariella thermophila TaxID=1931992 RepID=A0A4D4IZV8_9PSEU|nr:LysE family translocator [Gandjariella thermophila]GDY28440.1 amino acid transporter LysE [Gandjariella thermophila]
MSQLLPYVGLCVLIALTPGLDTAVVVRSALHGGTRAGLFTAVGCAAGLLVHATAVAVGVAELLLRSAAAYQAMRLAGAVLLIVLGARSLWLTWWRGGETPQHEIAAEAPLGDVAVRRGKPFVQGLLTDLTNPKATLFFVATLPQFIPLGRPSAAVPIALALATITLLCSLAWLSVTAVAVNRARHLLGSPRMRRAQETMLGAALIGLGVRVAIH